MSNETPEFAQGAKSTKQLRTLIPFEDFKAVLGIDDREVVLGRYCLITATYAIEQYCKRRLVKTISNEQVSISKEQGAMSKEELVLPLREYPVRKIVSIMNEQGVMSKGELIGAEFYRVIPDCGDLEDVPVCLWVSPALRLIRGALFKVRYWAGYSAGKVPPDLGSACLELAAWNMSRYRGRRIGMTGAVRGSGRDGEHLESSMPENVRQLLEPYRRKTI
jgi:hypothetical protein